VSGVGHAVARQLLADGYRARGRRYERRCIGSRVTNVGSSASLFVDSRVLVLLPKLLHVYLTLLPISDRDHFEDRVPVGFRRELGGGRVRTCREVRTRDLRL